MAVGVGGHVGKPLWRRIKHYVNQARALDDMSAVRTVGIDETSLRRGQHYITVVHDLDAKRLLFACEGRDHRTVGGSVEDLKAHGGDPAAIARVCQDMSAVYTKGSHWPCPKRPSATTASTSSSWPPRPWTRCAVPSGARIRACKATQQAAFDAERERWREAGQAEYVGEDDAPATAPTGALPASALAVAAGQEVVVLQTRPVAAE